MRKEDHQLPVNPDDPVAWNRHLGITRQVLKPPNESEWDIGRLRWGRSLYEEITKANPNKNPANEKYYERVGSSLQHWRLKRGWQQLLTPPDPRALVPLHHDPTWEWCIEDGGIYRQWYALWSPQTLWEGLFNDPEVLDQVIRVMHAPGMFDTRPLSLAINIHFRTVYLPAYEEHFKATRSDEHNWERWFLPITWEQHKLKALRYFEDAAPIIGGCMVHHYQVWTDDWLPKLIGLPAIEEMYMDVEEEIKRKERGDLLLDFA